MIMYVKDSNIALPQLPTSFTAHMLTRSGGSKIHSVFQVSATQNPCDILDLPHVNRLKNGKGITIIVASTNVCKETPGFHMAAGTIHETDQPWVESNIQSLDGSGLAPDFH
uniref:Uncharacterized protein n=1 Tax=Cacopsylla melanoneura TaxID=428564 RepID=A0A8D8ZQS6_9HEMI